MNEIVLTISMLTPSGNQLSGYHWRKRRRMKRDWQWLLLAAMGRAGVGVQLGRFHVTIERHAPRQLDPDNAVAGCKAVIDAMVGVGLLQDDSPAYVAGLIVEQRKTPRAAQQTVIRLRPASGSSSPTSAPAPRERSPA